MPVMDVRDASTSAPDAECPKCNGDGIVPCESCNAGGIGPHGDTCTECHGMGGHECDCEA